ncbi:FbpB family small basic protein [Lentibacillus amyloliquefaciens]|nr:FbpB family small basic protein [Lentibacillus amyloliquefaciens]
MRKQNSLEELTDQIKEALLNDEEALKAIEQKLDEKYAN